MFESPEDELMHFLEKMRSPDWVWAGQYQRSAEKDEAVLMQDSVLFVDNGTESMFIMFFFCRSHYKG
jgi:hypothetical protein